MNEITEFSDKNVCIVVGNGFDLNLGLETSYKEFWKWFMSGEYITRDDTIDFSEYVKKRDRFLQFIHTPLIVFLHNSNNENWYDLEYSIQLFLESTLKSIKDGTISRKPFTTMEESLNSFKEEIKDSYNQLKKYLKQYLNEVNEKYEIIDTNKLSYKIIETFFSNKFRMVNVLNFNYTDTVDRIYELLTSKFDSNDHLIFTHKVNYIHGKLDEEIVFGIDDKFNCTMDFVYMLKSYDKHTNNLNISAYLENSDIIVFFGYSLGKCDESYFDDFFKSLCTINNNYQAPKNKIIIICYKGQSDYDLKYFRLKELTGNNTAKLLRYNEIMFFDVDRGFDFEIINKKGV